MTDDVVEHMCKYCTLKEGLKKLLYDFVMEGKELYKTKYFNLLDVALLYTNSIGN